MAAVPPSVANRSHPCGRSTAHRQIEIGVHDLLDMGQHAVGHRVVVAVDRIGELAHPGVGVETQDVHAIAHPAAQQCHRVGLRLTGQEPVEAGGDAVCSRHSGQSVEFVPVAAGFIAGEPADQIERLPADDGGPVGVAAAGVDHGVRVLFHILIGEIDEFVLQFEGAQLFVLLLGDAVDCHVIMRPWTNLRSVSTAGQGESKRSRCRMVAECPGRRRFEGNSRSNPPREDEYGAARPLRHPVPDGELGAASNSLSTTTRSP